MPFLKREKKVRLPAEMTADVIITLQLLPISKENENICHSSIYNLIRASHPQPINRSQSKFMKSTKEKFL